MGDAGLLVGWVGAFVLKQSSTNHDSLPTSLLRADRSVISGTVGDRFSAAVAHALPFAYITNAAESTVSVIEPTVGMGSIHLA